MSHPRRPETLRESISRCQTTASERSRVSLRTYKTIKATAQLLAVGAGIFAIHQGADPMATFTIIGAIVAGPELLEYQWASDGNGNGSDNG